MERFGGVGSHLDAVDVDTIVGGKHLLKVGHLIVLVALHRHPLSGESLEGRLPRGVERACAVAVDGFAVGVE